MNAPDLTIHPENVLIIDFGSQVTQLIARRVREAGVYSEIVPFQSAEEGFQRLKPKAVIFLRRSVLRARRGQPARAAGCHRFRRGRSSQSAHGQQTLCHQLGGKVEGGHHREFGRADVEILKESPLFDGFWTKGSKYPVWMSHGDRVTELPEGFEVIGTSPNAPFAIAADEARKYYTTMFHPEVVHTPDGAKLLANFVHRIAGLKGDWTMAAYKDQAIAAIREQVGDRKVICGLSGGVRFQRRRRADPRGDRRPADLHPRRPRIDAQERGGRSRRHVPRILQHPAGPCGRGGPVHRRAGRRGRSRGQAQDHRQALHRCLRGRGEQDRRRRFPRPGHALSRCHRERLLFRRPLGHDQVAPQCRRSSRAL